MDTSFDSTRWKFQLGTYDAKHFIKWVSISLTPPLENIFRESK